MEKVLEGNKLIAEFMGGRFHKLDKGNFDGTTEDVFWFIPRAGSYKRPAELDYHIRWDWLSREPNPINKQ